VRKHFFGKDLLKRPKILENNSMTKSVVVWDVTPCRPVEVLQYFGGMYCFHFVGR
jgi:hypothetical protein